MAYDAVGGGGTRSAVARARLASKNVYLRLFVLISVCTDFCFGQVVLLKF